jgi:branched-chain amino acid transport system ATP-binding protein
MSKPLLHLSDVTKSFGGIKALSGLSCEVRQGQIVGVIGPNGAGKTTLFNVITGAYRANSGNVYLAQQAITHWRPYRIARAGAVRTFQNIRLFSSMTVWEHLLVAQPGQGALWRRALPTRWADGAAIARAEQVLEFFGLKDVRHQSARALSYGTQRKVEMARALTANPKLLLLDEPVAGMNSTEKTELMREIVAIQGRGYTIFMIEHDMRFVMGLCEEISVLNFGKIIAQGGPGQIRNDPQVIEAYLGREDDEVAVTPGELE